MWCIVVIKVSHARFRRLLLVLVSQLGCMFLSMCSAPHVHAVWKRDCSKSNVHVLVYSGSTAGGDAGHVAAEPWTSVGSSAFVEWYPSASLDSCTVTLDQQCFTHVCPGAQAVQALASGATGLFSLSCARCERCRPAQWLRLAHAGMHA